MESARDTGLSQERKNVMETIIGAVASGLGNSIGWAAETGLLFVAFALLWGVFGVALAISQGSVDAAWTWVRSLPWVLQGVVWVLFLPVMAGLWIWETTWPVVLRLLLVGGLAAWNLLVFLPRAVR